MAAARLQCVSSAPKLFSLNSLPMAGAFNSWKQRLFRQDPARPGADHAKQATADLVESLKELESDLAQTLEKMARLSARAAASTSQAMLAVQSGDDSAARTAVREAIDAQDSLAELGADVLVLRAMISECEQVLADAAARQGSPPAPA